MEKLTVNSTVGDALKNERAVVAIEAWMPGITKNPAIKMFQRLPLEKLTHMEQLHLPMEKLEAMLAQVNGD